jgi:signal transduction histidine kinase/ActR/RegA family two-component response regulator
MRTIFVCCGAVLVITTVAFFTYDLYSFRQHSIQQLRTLGAAIASNSTEALAIGNTQDAELVLSALRADPSVKAAVLYDASDQLFAVFPADLDRELLPVPTRETAYEFRGLRAVGFQPVVDRSGRLGTLYVESDLGAMFERARLYGLIVLLVAGFAGLAAYLISRQLQQRLMRPILAFKETAQAISDRQDYSVRAVRSGTHEFDVLTDAFNHMLTEIQQSGQKLHSQLGRMGLLQHITRAIGDRQDMNSIFDVVLGSLEDNLVDFACVLFHDRDARTLSVGRLAPASVSRAQQAGLTDGLALSGDQNGLSRCLTGQLVYEPDVADVPFAFASQLAAAGQRSVVLAPLMLESEVHGVLVCARVAPDSFSSSECEFLKQLAEHVALASHQAMLNGALQQAYDDLRQSQQTMLQQERLRALGQMASGIAHDINNAISPVALYTESLLEREPGLSERARSYLTTIQQSVEDVARTVSRMREFYRERDAQHTLGRVDLNRSVRQVLELTRPRWSDQPQQRSIVIELKAVLDPQLPELTGADNEIRDALTNLVFNAVDAMPEGGTLTVETRTVKGKDAVALVVIEVSDTGVGMDEDTRRRCLEPFYTTKGERGTGLGLAMVYGMVQRHNAELAVDSAPGRGTTIRLTFPASTSTAVVAPQAGVMPRLPRPLRILLVDDDPLLLQSLRNILQHDGHVVVAAGGGQAGIDAFNAARGRGENLDLVITDLGMPFVDGRKVAAAVKALSPATPVLMLTGWGQRMVVSSDMPSHVDRVLGKPARVSELRATFAELVP